MLVTVDDDGPAAKASFMLGDILIAFGDQALTDTNDVQALLGTESVGKSLAAKLIRGGELKTLPISVAERK
jgi:S1-C subfamily serine protease